jgi:hypothetical protein
LRPRRKLNERTAWKWKRGTRQAQQRLELFLLGERETPLTEDWTLTQYSTKKAALRAVDSQAVQQRVPDGPQVSSVIQGYRLEKIPTRTDTRRSYESWIKLHIVPKWDTVNYPSFRRGRSNYG